MKPIMLKLDSLINQKIGSIINSSSSIRGFNFLQIATGKIKTSNQNLNSKALTHGEQQELTWPQLRF